MARQPTLVVKQVQDAVRAGLSGPHNLALIPAIVLGAFWVGGEGWLVLVALGLPLLYAVVGGFSQSGLTAKNLTVPPQWTAVSATSLLDARLASCVVSGRQTLCAILVIDDFNALIDRHGRRAGDVTTSRIIARLRSALRDGDQVIQMADGRFCISTTPVRQLDLELAIQLSGRLQNTVEEPISLDGVTVYVSCSLGFCLSARNPGTTGTSLLAAAEAAATEALRNGPSAIRAHCAGMVNEGTKAALDADEVARALEAGEIIPWFQPQISTDTGQITGVEALARWIHPQRGLIAPIEFLHILETSNQMLRLGEVMLYNALSALKSWDRAGLHVPQIGVNFSTTDLRNPKLVEKIKWELDRFDLLPDRLCIEVLETVVATSPDDTVTRNINGLAKLGCQIDLDDFGTGHASIASLRRFAVSRIKVDRSFVMKVDRDPDQQRMVAAILTLAERLGLETLAEGVETLGEHAMLAQLGCGHVQGFGIARPMPLDQTGEWIRTHQSNRPALPEIKRAKG